MSMSSLPHFSRGDFHTQYQGRSIDDLIIQYMEENQVPGMALSIVQAPYITRVVGYGFSDIEHKLLVASHTAFNIGQITNAFTGVAIMQLKELNKLALVNSLTDLLPDLPMHWNKITIHHLLTHTSGLPSYTDSREFDYSKDYTASDIISHIGTQELLFEPGEKANYSATNYYLLGLIIEKISGMSYEDFITQNQIERVGLKDTFFISNKMQIVNTKPSYQHGQFLHDRSLINPIELAVGYSINNGQLDAPSWSATFSDSGIISSAQDISLWDISLAGDILLKDPENRNYLYHPVTLNTGQQIPGNAGWFFTGHPGLMEIKGNIPGFSAFLSRFTDPNELLCVTLLANKGDLPDLDVLARKIAAAFESKLAAPAGSCLSETIQSPYSVQETIDRIALIVEKQGGKVFSRINHNKEAENVALELQPTQVIMIGNPAKGTLLMQENAAIALDLPFRIMATKDAQNQVWLSYTLPSALTKQYHFHEEQQELIHQLVINLRRLCQKAISPFFI